MMEHADQTAASWEKQEAASEQLCKSLDKLAKCSDERLEEEYGLARDFAEQVQTNESALELCEKSMEKLADGYVQHLEAFKEAVTAQEELEHLEEAEVIWQTETRVIKHFDQDGGETAFFERMREAALVVLEDKLEEVSERCSRCASDENIATVIGIVAVMDQIWGEMGRGVSHPQRQQLRKIAASFQ